MGEIRLDIHELRNRLGHYLRQVKEGQTIILTEKGKPIGQILPIGEDLQARLRRLAQSGLVEWNGQPLPPYRPGVRPRDERTVAEIILEGRE